MPPNKKKPTRRKNGPSQEERRRKAANQALGGSGPPPGYESRRGAYDGGRNYNARSQRITKTLTVVMAVIMLLALFGSLLVGCLDTRGVVSAQGVETSGVAANNSTPASYSRVRYIMRQDSEQPQTNSLPAPTETLPDTTIYIGQTGHYLKDPFLRFWRAQGGEDLLGNPISEEFEQNGRRLQYFERALLEYNPDARGTRAEVTMAFLGSQLAAAKGLSFTPSTDTTSTATRTFFKETNHSVSGAYKTFWEKNDGLNLLGFPISEPLTENSGLNVQYFERGRLETNTAGQVQISNSGDLLLQARGWARPMKLPMELNIADTEIYQGRTLSIRLDNSGAWTPKITNATIADKALRLFDVNGVLKAFNSFAPSIPPKTYPLKIEFTDPAGRLRRISQPITVVSFDFPLQRIYVAPETLDPTVEEAEDKRIFPLYDNPTPQPLWSGKWGAPSPQASEAFITTEFGERRAYNDSPTYNVYHGGIDYAEPMGAPVWAPAAGKVVFTDLNLKVRGGTVIIDHGLGVFSQYYHLSQISVKPGQLVQPGDSLGRVGTSGRSDGPHLHWEVRVNGIVTDPRLFQKQDLSK